MLRQCSSGRDVFIPKPPKDGAKRVNLMHVRLTQGDPLGDPLVDGPSKMVHLRVDLTKVRLAQGSP